MFKVIDLFAGAGGLSLGFEMTEKFNTVAFVENNDRASNTYIENHPRARRYVDIKTVDFSEILSEVGKIDVVIGGPPCQGFSNANRQKRKIISGNNELVKKYVAAIAQLKPDVFVMENVKTIASDKHSFYMTLDDENHVSNELGVNINTKDCILYDRQEYLNELFELVTDTRQIDECMLPEKNFLAISTLLKKRKKAKEFIEKKDNIKLISEVISKLEKRLDIHEWYLNVMQHAREALLDIYNNKDMNDTSYKSLRLYVDIQNLFNGISELNNQNVIYSVHLEGNQIFARMKTYIVIDYIRASFSNLGYTFKGGILNAAQFGVPQKRERFILIGVKKELAYDNEFNLPEPIIKEYKDYFTVKDAIADLENFETSTESMDYELVRENIAEVTNIYHEIVFDSKRVYNHVCTETTAKAKKRFSHIGQGQNFHSLPDELKDTYENPKRTQNTIYKRLLLDEPSDTVVNVRKSMWIHPNKDRAISAREAARLQSFPDSYKFIGTKDSVYQQIGNAVPPLLGRAIAEQVLNIFNCNDFISIRELYERYSK